MSLPVARRRFLENCGLLATGAALGALTPQWFAARETQALENPAAGPEARLRDLGIELPEVKPPTAIFVPTVLVGELLHVAGHVPKTSDGNPVVGKVGRDLDVKEAQDAARLAGIGLLASVRDALGSLDRVVRLVKTLGMVNCTPDFTQQPLVVNGFSQLMVDIFGETAGKGARSAVGMGSLPGGVPVEVECIFQVRT